MKVNQSHSLIWFILLSVNFALGSPAISNITITPNQGTGTITISYSIEGVTNTAEVTAQASIDGGSSYSVSLSNATGAVGTGITNGSGKTIVWQADQDLPNGGPFEMRIKLDAFEQSTGSSGSINEEYPTQDFTVSSAYKLPKTGCTWDSPHLPYDDGELQIGREFSFTDNGDGTVTDNNTGLMWIQDFNMGRNDGDFFEDANATKLFVDNLEYAGYNDWRLPTRKELCFIMKVTDDPMDVFDRRYFTNVNALPLFFEDSVSSTKQYSWDPDSNLLLSVFKLSRLNELNFSVDFDIYYDFRTTQNTLALDTYTWAAARGPWSVYGNFGNLVNVMMVRGDDLTSPGLSQINENEFLDSNNNLTYKIIDINSSMINDVIKNEIKSGEDDFLITNRFTDYYLRKFASFSEENFGYRIPNLNELLNLYEVHKFSDATSSTTAPKLYNAKAKCDGNEFISNCRTFYYIKPGASASIISQYTSGLPSSIILVKSL